MSKSFLVKRIQKVNTGFFPWSRETLVQGCCVEYEEVVNVESDFDSSIQTSLSEFRILTPYKPSTTSSFCSIASSCRDCDKECYASGLKDDEIIIPSPLGYETQAEEKKTYLQSDIIFPSWNNARPTTKYISPYHIFAEDMKRHQCEYCFRWFERSSSLSNHRLIHKNSKTFKCPQCNMSFLRKSDLAKHMVTHSGCKPYQCNVCGKRFSQSSNMLTHQRRHTGIRPYSCEICGKAFYRKVDVRRHMSVHKRC